MDGKRRLSQAQIGRREGVNWKGTVNMNGQDGQDGGEKDRPQIDTDKHRLGMANENLAELRGPQGAVIIN
jgi:hypothetical protein